MRRPTRNAGTRRYRRRGIEEAPRADRTTVWLLIVVISGLVLALTFGDAQGASGLLHQLLP